MKRNVVKRGGVLCAYFNVNCSVNFWREWVNKRCVMDFYIITCAYVAYIHLNADFTKVFIWALNQGIILMFINNALTIFKKKKKYVGRKKRKIWRMQSLGGWVWINGVTRCQICVWLVDSCCRICRNGFIYCQAGRFLVFSASTVFLAKIEKFCSNSERIHNLCIEFQR